MATAQDRLRRLRALVSEDRPGTLPSDMEETPQEDRLARLRRSVARRAGPTLQNIPEAAPVAADAVRAPLRAEPRDRPTPGQPSPSRAEPRAERERPRIRATDAADTLPGGDILLPRPDDLERLRGVAERPLFSDTVAPLTGEGVPEVVARPAARRVGDDQVQNATYSPSRDRIEAYQTAFGGSDRRLERTLLHEFGHRLEPDAEDPEGFADRFGYAVQVLRRIGDDPSMGSQVLEVAEKAVPGTREMVDRLLEHEVFRGHPLNRAALPPTSPVAQDRTAVAESSFAPSESIADTGPVGEAAAGLGRFVGQVPRSIGNVARAISSTPPAPVRPGEDVTVPMRERGEAGAGLQRLGQRIQESPALARSEEAEEPWTPRWWIAGLSETAPQLLMQIGAAALTGGGSTAAQFAAFAAPTAVLEGGNAYESTLNALREQGVADEEAEPLAAGTSTLTAAGAVILEKAPFATHILKRYPGAQRVLQEALAKRLVRIGTGAASEGFEEAAQEAWADVMQYVATEDPETFEGLRERSVQGAALGAVLGGAVHAATGPQPVDRPSAVQDRISALRDIVAGEQRVERVADGILDEQRQRQAAEALVPERPVEAPVETEQAVEPVAEPTEQTIDQAEPEVDPSDIPAAGRSTYMSARSSAGRVSDDQLRDRFLRNVRLAFATGAEGSRTRAEADELARLGIEESVGRARGSTFRARGMTTQAEARSKAYEDEARKRGLELPHPDEAFVDADPSDFPDAVRAHYERALDQLPDLQEIRNEPLMVLLDTAEREAVSNTSDPVAQIKRAIVSGVAHRRGLFEEDMTPAMARGPDIPFDPAPRADPAEVQEDAFGGSEVVGGTEQRDLGLERPRPTLERTERLARQTIDRLRPKIEGGGATEAETTAYREALALVRRGEGQSAEEVQLRAREAGDIDDGASEGTGDLFADPAATPSGEPPVPEGHVRLYRAESGDLENRIASGVQFTGDLAAAQRYQRQGRGEITYLDIPEAELQEMIDTSRVLHRQAGRGGTYILPDDLAERRAPVPSEPLADPGDVARHPADSPVRTDPASADPYLTLEGARAIGDRMAGNLETPTGFRGRPTAAPEILRSLEAVTEAAGKKIRIRQGRAGGRGIGRARGAFFPMPEVQRVRQANNVPTATHETAHALEQLIFGRVKGSPWTEGTAGVSRTIQKELVRMGRDLYGDTKPNGGYKREGWAEFLRMWVTGTGLDARPANLETKAPETLRWFEETFSREHPDVRKALDEAQRLTTRFREQGSVQRARAGIVDPLAPGAQARRATEGVRDFFSMENWVEMALPLAELSKAVERETGSRLRPEEDPYVTISALRTTHDARVRYMVEEGMIDLNGNRVGDPLTAIRNIVKGRKDDFMIYLWARRTLAEQVRGQGRETGLNLQDATQIIEELDSPGFQLAAQKVYEWNDGVLNYAAQASPTFKAVVDQVREKDPGNYIPLLREFEEMDRQWSRGGASSRSPVQRFKGSGRRIKDPFQSMIGKASQTVAQAHKRRVLDQMIRLAEVEGVGALIVEVPKDRRPAYATSVGQLIDQIERTVGSKVEVAGLEETGPLEKAEILGHLVTFFSPVDVPTQQDGENPILPIYDEGRVRWFEVDRGLYDTLASIDIYRLPKVLDMTLGVSARTFRAGTTGLRASFGLIINPLRDVQTMYVNTQSSAAAPRVFFEWLRSMGEVALWRTTGQRTEWVDAFMRLGLEMSQPLGQDIRHTRRAARRVFEGRTVRTLDPRNWYDWFRDLMQTPESAPRIAELRMVANDIGWEPGQPMSHEQALQLMQAASQVTTDFKAAGRLSRIVNQGVAFHNAGIQGPRAHVRALRRNPMKFTARMLQMTAASLLLWWSFKDDEWYTQMDAREKYLYWHIPFDHPVTGEPELLRIPRAFEVGGIGAALPEFLADAAYRQDPEIMKAWADAFVESSTPPLVGVVDVDGVPVPYLENPAVEMFAEQLANRRFYFDTPIVPQGDERKPAEEQFNEYTTRVAITLGEMFDASPRRIDHAMQGLFGPVSRDLTEVLGLGPSGVDRDKELSDLPVVGRLFQRGGRFGTRPKSVDELYELAEKAVQRQYSDKVPETEDQRQMRLQIQDATRALTALSFVRQYTSDRKDREALTRAMANVADEALAAHQEGIVHRRRFAGQRKGAERLKEQVKDERARLADEERSRFPKRSGATAEEPTGSRPR